MRTESGVQDRILHAAKQEFLQYGYKDASLRRIAMGSHCTTGAIYTYFKDKQALFDAVVSPVTMHVQNVFSDLSKHYYEDDRVVCEISFERTISDLRTVYGFIYQHIELFKILLLGASGSKHAEFVHELVTWEMQHTLAYLQRLGMSGDCVLQSDTGVLHTISEGYINAILEPVRHNMSLEEALHNLELIVTFYTGGWLQIIDRYCPFVRR